MDLKSRRINTFKQMKQMVTEYYMISKFAEGQMPIAWVTSGAPVELLHAMDIIPIYPENHGAMIGAAHLGPTIAAEAEQRGWSPDLCSYARCDFGDVYSKKGPIGGLPKPDVLICSNNICGTVTKWYQELSREFSIPLLMLDTPFLYRGMDDDIVQYVKVKLEEMVASLEKIFDKKMDPEKLKEAVTYSLEGIDLWSEVLSKGANKPAPLSCFDAFMHMVPIVTFRGQKKCNDYYKTLIQELDQRIADDFGAIPNERIRLLWDNIPLWFEMTRLSETLADHGAVLVADTYTHAWCSLTTMPDPSKPMESLAAAYTGIYLNEPLEAMVAHVMNLARKFSVDGVVLHSNRSCKPYSIGQYDMARILKEEYNLPVLIIDGDMTDERNFSSEQTYTRLEAFLEMLGG